MVRPEAVRMAGNEVIRHFETIDLMQIFPILSVIRYNAFIRDISLAD
jgi:hypothetical protein